MFRDIFARANAEVGVQQLVIGGDLNAPVDLVCRSWECESGCFEWELKNHFTSKGVSMVRVFIPPNYD